MLDSLPSHLQDRARVLGRESRVEKEGPVVVWLKSSLRVHENPALDVGRMISSLHGRPLLVYQAVDERYPWASLRHHNMLLDGAVDLHHGCEGLGLRYVLHIARNGHRQSAMRAFGETASCIVTDLFPLPPWTGWVRGIADKADCPVIEVDCHCVIPMTLYGKSVDRPFKFRSATKKFRKRLLGKPWEDVDVEVEPYLGELPFEPVDVVKDVESISRRFDLLRECAIDPTVFPVWAERGGEMAGLSRWQAFLEKGLRSYARRRNNAADASGVSRMSSAFHYGFVSPMMVAREAAAIGTKSSEKYLDELLIFREHAWHHAASLADPYDPSNLPDWALGSWDETADDPRLGAQTELSLEYATTPSNLWNLCQKSLLWHGELHNNLRMTWGKAFPQWTPTLEASIEIAQRLNDKYALDGRDPSSVAGVQWCHGLFDRPFHPSAPIMGTVRQRSIDAHSSRLDVGKYESHVGRAVTMGGGVVLVAGPGIVMGIIADVLRDNGVRVHRVEGSWDEPQDLGLEMASLPISLRTRVARITRRSTRSNGIGDNPEIVAVIHASSIEASEAIEDSGLTVAGTAIRTPVDTEYADEQSFEGVAKEALWCAAGAMWKLNSEKARVRVSVQKKLF